MNSDFNYGWLLYEKRFHNQEDFLCIGEWGAFGGYFCGINTISKKLQPKLNRSSEEAGFDREVLASDAE
jgi:hypothetical protein